MPFLFPDDLVILLNAQMFKKVKEKETLFLQ